MANTANLSLSTNFNVSPYYDDFDETKQFYRIVYKPGYAVQARELTQMQTILQKQIERHGRHIFIEGSIVIPGNFQLYCANTQSSIGPLSYVKVKDIDASNNVVNISDFNDVEVEGVSSGVKGFVNIVIDGSDTTPNTKTIYVDYLNVSNSNSAITTFQAGETLQSNVGSLKVVDTNATGFGSAFRISSGVVFSKGFFIYFPTQEVVLSRYNSVPTCKVGFKIIETIVDSTSDSSLLDPALEASNYSAPGADRLRLDAELQVRDYNDPETIPDFVTLFTIKDGIIQTVAERTQYSILKDEWAKRTFDESGDYYVSGLGIELRDHLDTGTNGGVYSLAQGGNSALISVKVEPGVAYVKGYEVGTIVPTYLTTEKSTAHSNVENQLASAFLGSYITVNDMTGHLPLDVGTQIDLYDTYQDRLSNGAFSSVGASPAGTKIGEAKLASIEYNSGELGTATGKVDIYLLDIRMTGSNNFSSVKSVYVNNVATPDFFADIVPDAATGVTTLYEPFNVPLLFYTGSNFTRKIKDTDGTSDTTYTYSATLPVSITAGGFTASAPGSDSLPYTGTLSTTSKREIFLSLNSSVNVSTGITASNVSGNTILGTNFNKLNVGDKIEFGGLSNTYSIVSIANSTQLVIDQNPFSELTGNAVFKAYKAGDYVDLTSLGFDTGTVRSVSASGSTLTFELNEADLTSIDASVTIRVAKNIAVEAAKTLRPSRYVQINCASAGVTGPYNLGFSDVYRIKQIRKKSSAVFTSNTEGTVVTTQFNVDNGQRDTHYDLAAITPILPMASTDRLLVELDYFIPDYSGGKGYFSVDSYNANDTFSSASTISTAEIPIYKSPTSGETYDLRNHLDFRPVKAITAADSTTVAGASINPSSTAGFNYVGAGINLVAPSSEIRYDYSYYLARKDVVHVNKNKVFSITKGTPATVPITPQIGDNEMALAVLTIAPYPSISPYYAKLISRQDIASSSRKVAAIRHTMRDIGVMKERIGNLEYYASLSLLEKNALDMLITDEEGQDRFKNGIFVDTFSDHSLGATYDKDYRIVVDTEEKSIRPVYSMQSIDYDYLSGSGVRKSGDIVTLDYTEVEYANVSSVTSTLNTEKSTYRFIGNLTLFPSEDVWVDTITLPPNVITFNDTNIDGMEDAQQGSYITTTWNAWQTVVVGYKVYKGTGTSKVLVGTYTSRYKAEDVADDLRTTSRGSTIETLYKNTRTGVEFFNYNDADTASIGSRVVNTQIIPYIRPQTLIGHVSGLKPYASFNVFFDGIDMNAYTRPITSGEFADTNSVMTWTYALGDTLYADATGELWFRLTLPRTDNLRFTTGQKIVMVTDSPTNSDDEATSFAEKMFFAQGITQTKQDTILSTKQTEVRQKAVSQTTNSSTWKTLPPLPPPRRSNSCLAYALPIKAPDGEEGIFLTAVEVFCAEKHPTLGVWFEIRELDAGGGITLNQVPLTEKWYKNDEVPISTDGITNGLKVTFDSPVFLYSDKSYAFIIHPEGTNPNYYFWISRIGETDVNTGQQITSRAFTGTTFTTNNFTIWLVKDLVDLTCKWYRAAFVPSGQFEIGNKPKEKIYLRDFVETIEGYGEPIVTGDKLTLTGYSGSTIQVNDLIVGSTSLINASVLNINSGIYSTANIRYTVGETVTVRYGTNAASKGTATISAINNGRGYLEYYKEAANATYMILTSSNGNFTATEAVFDISDQGSAVIDKITNLRYSLIDFEPSVITFAKTTQAFELATYANTGVAQNYLSIDYGENYEFDKEMAIFSRSNEIASLSSNRSNKVRVSMATSSSYLSPVFDLAKTQSIIVDNLINNDATNETNPSGGNLFNKYISKIVTLADGQDAEDMKVFLTAYRPPTTDIKVWIKLLNGEDADTLASKSWIELEKNFGGDILYSSYARKTDFKEFTFNVPASYLTGSQGQIQYTNSQGTQFTGYKLFQVKIGLLGTNSAVVPRVADLRVIALQV
jgi:hypothetical protein